MRHLSREYGYAAVGVYIALSAFDLPICYAGVSYLGTERIGRWEQIITARVKDWTKWLVTATGMTAALGSKRQVEERVEDVREVVGVREEAVEGQSDKKRGSSLERGRDSKSEKDKSHKLQRTDSEEVAGTLFVSNLNFLLASRLLPSVAILYTKYPIMLLPGQFTCSHQFFLYRPRMSSQNPYIQFSILFPLFSFLLFFG